MKKNCLLFPLSLAACASVPADHGCAVGRSAVSQASEILAPAPPLTSGINPTAALAAQFAFNEPRNLQLHPDPEVTYATLPKGAGEERSYGGLAGFTVLQAGLYFVKLGTAGWIDVSINGAPLPPACFGPGALGSPDRKVVGYQLQPGSYTLEISGQESANLRVEIQLKIHMAF